MAHEVDGGLLADVQSFVTMQDLESVKDLIRRGDFEELARQNDFGFIKLLLFMLGDERELALEVVPTSQKEMIDGAVRKFENELAPLLNEIDDAQGKLISGLLSVARGNTDGQSVQENPDSEELIEVLETLQRQKSRESELRSVLTQRIFHNHVNAVFCQKMFMGDPGNMIPMFQVLFYNTEEDGNRELFQTNGDLDDILFIGSQLVRGVAEMMEESVPLMKADQLQILDVVKQKIARHVLKIRESLKVIESSLPEYGIDLQDREESGEKQ
ncbi:MAG: hypothetical protein HQL07_07345 [Nitrospirae bacterium]|nr:hypothetical protein [Magnetococcales bacterium]HAT49553.1 hypothetical protein [Alphaproteobacteria bacterium]